MAHKLPAALDFRPNLTRDALISAARPSKTPLRPRRHMPLLRQMRRVLRPLNSEVPMLNAAIEAVLAHPRLQEEEAPLSFRELSQIVNVSEDTLRRTTIPRIRFGEKVDRLPVATTREFIQSLDDDAFFGGSR
jgi:hypothetical protein